MMIIKLIKSKNKDIIKIYIYIIYDIFIRKSIHICTVLAYVR